jgi:hypothetical protein
LDSTTIIGRSRTKNSFISSVPRLLFLVFDAFDIWFRKSLDFTVTIYDYALSFYKGTWIIKCQPATIKHTLSPQYSNFTLSNEHCRFGSQIYLRKTNDSTNCEWICQKSNLNYYHERVCSVTRGFCEQLPFACKPKFWGEPFEKGVNSPGGFYYNLLGLEKSWFKQLRCLSSPEAWYTCIFVGNRAHVYNVNYTIPCFLCNW